MLRSVGGFKLERAGSSWGGSLPYDPVMTSAQPDSEPFHELSPLLRGAAAIAPGSHGGLVPQRLPRWAQFQHNDPLLRSMVKFPAGVALRFSTTADSVTLTILTQTAQVDGAPTPAPPELAVTLPGATPDDAWQVASTTQIPRGEVAIVDDAGRLVQRVRAEPSTITLPLPERVAGTAVEILLPHNCVVELFSLTADAPVLPVPHDDRLRWTHYGSSISHGLEVPSPTETWPSAVALSEGWALQSLAFAGGAHLDPFVARTIRDLPADLITLKVGINLINADTMRERALLPALHGFLDTIREGNSAPIVLMSAISCPALEDAAGPSVNRDGRTAPARRELESDDGALTLSRTRAVLLDVWQRRREADPDLFFLDGQTLFGAGDVHLAPDGLHPNPAGHELMAQRFPALLRAALRGAPRT